MTFRAGTTPAVGCEAIQPPGSLQAAPHHLGSEGREEEEEQGGRRGSGTTGRSRAEVRDKQGGSPGWLPPVFGGRGWVEEAAPGLRNGAANPAGQPGL